ncbi:YybH family protein [Sphingobacterium hungaricum]
MNTKIIPLSPEQMNEFFADAYNSGDVNRLNMLFESNAKIVRYDGTIVSGVELINEEHLNLLNFGGKMTSVNKYCVELENIALLRADWKIETKNDKSEDIVIEGSSSEIARKQSDGTWLYIVDNPCGAG